MSYSPRTGTPTNTAKSYGAVGDGSSHPLSGTYGTLGAAQAAYPNASITSLTQEIDRAAIQQLLHDYAGKDCYIDAGIYLIDVMLSFNPGGVQNGVVRGAGGGSGNNGTILRAKAGANLTAVAAFDGQYVHISDLFADGNNYSASYSLLTTGSLGAKAGWWFRACACSLFSSLGVGGTTGFGFWFDTSTGGISDGIQLDNPVAGGCGCMEVQSLVSTATGGTFTITVTNYLGSQTTGNIAYNADTTTILTALNALTTVNPSGDSGGSPHAIAAQATGMPANTNGPLGTHPQYLYMQGPLIGPQSLLTINTGGLSGGTVTCTRIQAGVLGGGFGWGGGADNNIVVLNKPRCSGTWGDAICLNGGLSHSIIGADLENNFGIGIRFTGSTSSPGTSLGGAFVVGAYFENCWQSYYDDTLGSGGSLGSLVLRTDNGNTGHGSYKLQSGRGMYNVEMVSDINGLLIINGTNLQVP